MRCGLAQVKDEDGRLMNDFTGRIKRDEWKPPSGAAPLPSGFPEGGQGLRRTCLTSALHIMFTGRVQVAHNLCTMRRLITVHGKPSDRLTVWALS